MALQALAKDIGITVAGRWQPGDTLYGDIQCDTTWPGGSDQLLWTPATPLLHRYAGGEPVVGYLPDSPLPIWAGTLTEPDASADQLVAVGAWQEGGNFPALDGSGNATKIPDVAIDAAIALGLNWTRPASISAAEVDIDISQGPVTVGALLDTYADNNGVRWGVDPYRQVYDKADDTTPTYQSYPLDGGMGFDLTNYASTLVGRYYNGTNYVTVNVDGPGGHGVKRITVDLTGRGTLTAAKATTILTNLLKLGVGTPSWTQGIGFSYGDILNPGGTPVALERVQATGGLLRVHGGYELAQRLNGAMYVDIPIGHTSLAGGLLTVQPQDVAVRNLADYVAKTPANRLTA
jgi:hypothetical protein